MKRREFLQLVGASAAFAMTPSVLRAQAFGPRIVVVGGGFAGATVAKYLRKWSSGFVSVTLVERSSAHVSCILSNLVLNGRVSLPSITFGFENLQASHGVQVRQDTVVAIEPGATSGLVRLASGQTLPYDHLVLAPGIAFDPVPGLESDALRPDLEKWVPHAWVAGDQTVNLRNQLQALPPGGTVIQTIPLKPYRCPPGPYERACVVADLLKRTKPGARLVLLDANPGIVAEVETFTNAFQSTYAGIVDYVPNASVEEVSFEPRAGAPDRRVAWARIAGAPTLTAFRGDVLNLIPRQKAASLITSSGLGLVNVAGRFAGVDPLSYESTVVPNVHVIGDSQGTGQPKAGHIANAEAKVCADAILRATSGRSPDPAPVTNSACYSPITFDTASWLTAVFQYDPVTKAMVSVPAAAGEAHAPSKDNFEKMFDWADNLFADTWA